MLRTALTHKVLAPLVPSLLVLLVAASSALAQRSYGGVPATEWSVLTAGAPTVTMPPIDVAQLRAEDAARGNWPMRYGATIPVALAPDTAGALDLAEDGSLVWRVRIASPGAHSLGLLFDLYELPPTGQLFVYDDARRTVLGAYTELNNKENGEFAIQPVPGDAVTLEYVQAPQVQGLPRLRVGTVVHDYVDVLRLIPVGGGGGGGGCLVDVNCPDGANWQDQKRSVARILSGGTLCTGALLNNTANDGTQLFLTANHCGGMNNAVFLFNYELPGCGVGSAPTNQSVQGSTLLANDSVGDFRLIRLTEAIPSTYDPFFAGWSRDETPTLRTVGIHHPGGAPKKISLDNDPPYKSNEFWGVNWEVGMLEGGSSGSPLFNRSGRVLGPACCVTDFDCNTQNAFYGRLGLYWDGVKAWLDPLASDPITHPGWEPPTGPNIVTITPTSLSAVTVDGPPTVTLTGTGFSTVTSVKVDGLALPFNPPSWLKSGDTQIDIIAWPLVGKLGTVSVELVASDGMDSTTVTLVANTPPVVELGGSDPFFLFNGLPLTITMGSTPGTVHFLALSPELLPSSLPGLVDYGIGNNFASLVSLGTHAIAAKGWKSLSIPVSGIPPGTKIHLQSGVFAGGTPLVMTNVQSGTFLF